MYRHSYGCRLALFFIEWSIALEKASMIPKAIEVIRLGIEMSAQPVSDLNAYLNSLKHRETFCSSYSCYETLIDETYSLGQNDSGSKTQKQGLKPKLTNTKKLYFLKFCKINRDEKGNELDPNYRNKEDLRLYANNRSKARSSSTATRAALAK
jgi:hypothetical protein